MNMKNVQNGPELDIVPNIQPSCFSIVESLVGPVDSNHVSHSDYLFFRPTLLYKVPSKSTGRNFVTNVYCFYLFNL